jgi:hypothetical protein
MSTTSNSFPGVKGTTFRAEGNSVHHERAQHRALVVHEREHDWLVAKVVAQRDITSRFILEARVERQSLAEPLRKRHVLHLGGNVGGHDAASEPHGARQAGLLLRARVCGRQANSQCNKTKVHAATRDGRQRHI